MNARRISLLVLAGLVAPVVFLCLPAVAQPEKSPWEKRWVYISNNLYVNENLPKIQAILERAKKCGYNGVLFTDYKMFTWWQLDDPGRWKANAQKLRKMTADFGLELNVCVFPFGYAGSLLWHDVNLAAGMPIQDAPLVRRGDRLVPEPTVQLRNGSFEESKGDRVSGFSFQDDPGKGSFIDARVVKHGRVSLRFENVGQANPHGHGRIHQKVAVRPWRQYRIRAWMKAEDLTADQIQLLAIGGGRVLQYQHVQARQGRRREHVSAVRGLTTDWIEQSVTFNSLEHESVSIYAGVWGGKTGKIWWDDLRVDPAPTLNVLRRDSLPLTVKAEDGTAYEEGRDFARIVDPKLGNDPWPGSFNTWHEPPEINVLPNSRIKEGQRVLLGCYHATLVYGGQVNCSMSEPKVFELCALQLEKTKEALNPAGFFMSHDEIRSAGWEPNQTARFKTSGALFADNIKRCYQILRDGGGGKPVYVWSDMYDPNHNARRDYYLVNNTLEGSWLGLDSRVVVMKWGGGKIARPGLEFFAGRGHKQMIAAYYDGDVAANHRMWTEAAKDVPGVIGVMYTTWGGNYQDLERFAQTWWGK